MNNRDFRRLQALVGHPDFQRFCADLAVQSGVEIPRGTNPAGFVIANLHQEDPRYAMAFVGSVLREHERVHGAPREAPDDGHDWDNEMPPAEVIKAWKSLPEHGRIKKNASSPQFETLARIDLARMGASTLPGLTAGQTMAAYLHYVGNYDGKHSKALASGDREAWNSLAKRLGGVLGDGEGIRWMVEQAKELHGEDDMAHAVGEKLRASDAEAQKYRAVSHRQPVIQPDQFGHMSAEHTHLKHSLEAKGKPPRVDDRDATRAEVARAWDRQMSGGSLNGKPIPKTYVVDDETRFWDHVAYSKAVGEARAPVTLGPRLQQKFTEQLRSHGIEPATYSRDSGGGSTGGGGGYSSSSPNSGGSSGAAPSAPASTGTDQ